MTKRIKEANNIVLDRTEINSKILSSGQFSSDNIFIKKFISQNEEDEKEPIKYISSLKKENVQYSGMLNDSFLKEGYGLEIYSNGDKYFGQYYSDLRNDNGIYYSAPEKNEDNDNIKTECYMGQWKNNLKDKYGIYIWMEEPQYNNEYENSNFDAYIGEFEDEKYIRGSYLTKLNNEFSIYHGNFNRQGKKSDDNAYFYSSKTNNIFHGEIKNDIMISGYLGFFEENKDEVVKLLFCIFNKDGTVYDVIEEKDLKMSEDDILDEKKKIENFRKIILEFDYFGKIYSKFKKIKYKIDDLEDIAYLLENEENIKGIDKILDKFNKKNIFYSIEENFFGREL